MAGCCATHFGVAILRWKRQLRSSAKPVTIRFSLRSFCYAATNRQTSLLDGSKDSKMPNLGRVDVAKSLVTDFGADGHQKKSSSTSAA
jgi:hypothetical protein